MLICKFIYFFYIHLTLNKILSNFKTVFSKYRPLFLNFSDYQDINNSENMFLNNKSYKSFI